MRSEASLVRVVDRLEPLGRVRAVHEHVGPGREPRSSRFLPVEIGGMEIREAGRRALFDRQRARLRPVEFYERPRVCRPFRSKQLGALRRPEVEDFITIGQLRTSGPRRTSLELLKRVLGEATARGQKVDPAVLAIPPIKQPSAPRPRVDGVGALGARGVVCAALVAARDLTHVETRLLREQVLARAIPTRPAAGDAERVP